MMGYVQNKVNTKIKVGVIKLPHISNFTDFEPLIVDEEIALFFISSPSELDSCDLIVLPGTKRVVDDLEWLRERGFEKILSSKKSRVVAICGGYEMMFESIFDPLHIESKVEESVGFKRLKGSVTFQKEKIVHKGSYNLFGTMVDGYEIHNGITKKRCKESKNLYGTFIHGLFDSDALREQIFTEIDKEYVGYNFKAYKKKAISEFCEHIETHIDMKTITNALYSKN